ncbi:hypothetical protein K2Z84_06045, partial [Candidatus Binatia bacterium]|nr:hypothetical protein [Candidatus Binatia bacterium]
MSVTTGAFQLGAAAFKMPSTRPMLRLSTAGSVMASRVAALLRARPALLDVRSAGETSATPCSARSAATLARARAAAAGVRPETGRTVPRGRSSRGATACPQRAAGAGAEAGATRAAMAAKADRCS